MPAGHADVQLLCPARELKLPREQGKQSLEELDAGLEPKVPLLQLVHWPAPEVVLKLPIAHAKHDSTDTDPLLGL